MAHFSSKIKYVFHPISERQLHAHDFKAPYMDGCKDTAVIMDSKLIVKIKIQINLGSITGETTKKSE